MDSNQMRISYGDMHYEVRFYNGQGRRYAEMHLTSHVFKALNSFHESYHEQRQGYAELRQKVYALAADRPDLVNDLKERGLI